MFKVTLVASAAAVMLLVPEPGLAQQVGNYPLESATGLELLNVTAEAATWQGQKGVRLTISPEGRKQAEGGKGPVEQLARIKDLEFSNGVIELELAGAPAPDAPEGARGFVGIAFRVQPDNKTYDAMYLRPTNGRADDQERRNRSVQYISHPEWPWFRLRKETPAKYEAYVDLVPGAWTKVKVEVAGAAAKLYVHNSEQPTLIVNDVKTGANGKGAVALWLDVGTVAHFRNLKVTPK